MTLTEKDYKAIAAKIYEGRNNIEFEKGNETLFLECEFEVFGYREDDYFNGTGAFVETSRELNIESAVSYDENGTETPCKVNERLLERLVA